MSYDDKTEILTNKGWIPFSDYDGKTTVATINQSTHYLEFQYPIEQKIDFYDGYINFCSHDRLKFSLTPDHNIYVETYQYKPLRKPKGFAFKTMENMHFTNTLLSSVKGFIGTDISSVNIGKMNIDGDDWIRLIAIVLSCGWVGGTEANWKTISFCCYNLDRQDSVREFAKRIGFYEQISRRGVWFSTNLELADWFRANAYCGETYRSFSKVIPEIIKWTSIRQISLFLDFFGDRNHGKGGEKYYSTSVRMIDGLQEIVLRVGRRGSIHEWQPRDQIMKTGRNIIAKNCKKVLTLQVARVNSLGFTPSKHVESRYYCGKVFSVVVPNGLVITRRDRHVLFSGC